MIRIPPMTRQLAGTIALVCIAAAGCEKKRQSSGLAPATNWNAGAGSAPVAPTEPPVAGGGNPHGSVPGMAAGGGGDPHAGVPGMSPHGDGDPHAGMPGMAGGTDVTKLGLSAPDPNRKIDPNKVISGTIEPDAKVAAALKEGTALFVVAKRPGPDGAPAGAPVAVSRIVWKGPSLAFQLTEADQMIAGTDFSGDVIVSVRYDQDSDALSKQPGDVTGMAKVTIPNTKVAIKLDTVLQ